MSAVTLLASTLADSGVSDAIDIGTATALRLNCSLGFAAPENLGATVVTLESGPSSTGPWRGLRSSYPYVTGSSVIRLCAGGADQWCRITWRTVPGASASPGLTISCSGAALP